MSKLYGDRDAADLDEAGGYYMRHVMAMTSEGLDSKGAIAAELGYRDLQIDELKAVQQDADRLVRELDVLLNGQAGAANQASLCDLVAQVAKDGLVAKARFDVLLEAMHGVADILDELSQEDAVSSLKGGAAGAASGIRKSIIKIMGAAPAAGEK